MAWDDHSCLSLSEYQALRLNCCWSFPAELIGPSDSSWTLSSAKQFNGRQNSSGCVHLPFSPFCSPEFLIENIAVLFYLKTRDVKWRPHHHRYWEGGKQKKQFANNWIYSHWSWKLFLILNALRKEASVLCSGRHWMCPLLCGVPFSTFNCLIFGFIKTSCFSFANLLLFFLSASSAGSLNIVHSNFCAV